MKITPTTTLGELAVAFAAFGLTCHIELILDGRVSCEVTDERGIRGHAWGSSLPEAIDSALNTYQLNAFGPTPKKGNAP